MDITSNLVSLVMTDVSLDGLEPEDVCGYVPP